MIVLVDLSALFWSSWFSTQNGSETYEYVTGRLRGFVEAEPRVVICCEGGRPKRSAWYADYKANRPPKPPEAIESLTRIITELSTWGIPVLSCDGYEADDLIATIVGQAEDEPVLILSVDKDLAALLSPTVNMVIGEASFTVASCIEKFGVRPDQIGDLLTLAGDAADNIPGCPGVGRGRGRDLLQRFGSLDAIRAATDEELLSVKGFGKKTLTGFRAWDPALARRLVTLLTDAPIRLDKLWSDNNKTTETEPMVDMTKIITEKANPPLKILAYGPEGVGKAQPLTCEVLTPNGLKPIGDLIVGDLVIGSNGKPCSVTGVFPQGKKQVYRVTMTDGTFTRSCGEHLWATTRPDGGDKPKVRTLFQIMDTLHRTVSGDHAPPSGRYPNHRIPLVRPVEFEPAGECPLHPYLLGALLGDGSLTGPSITFHKPEQDVISRLASLLPGDDAHSMLDSDSGMRIRKPARGAATSHTYQALEKLGLIGSDSLTKFIPAAYLFAPASERLELLRGLCDTDGHVIHSGTRVEFSTSSPRLAADMAFLARSLGGLVTSTIRPTRYTYKGTVVSGADSYRIMLFFGDGSVPVSSVKNLAKWTGPKGNSYRSIESVDPDGEEECVCIRVDAEDSLYVTDDFILTHNTRFAAFSKDPIFLCAENGLTAPDIRNTPAFPAPGEWADALAAVEFLTTGQHQYKTFAIDSLDWLYGLLKAHVCLRESLTVAQYEDYGRGDRVALADWLKLVAALDGLQAARGMHVILIAHSTTMTFDNPTGENYTRFQLALPKTVAERSKQWPDYLLFMSQELLTAAKKNDAKKAVGVTGDLRIYTARTAAYDAKNRIGLPSEIEYETVNPWQPFAATVKKIISPKPPQETVAA